MKYDDELLTFKYFPDKEVSSVTTIMSGTAKEINDKYSTGEIVDFQLGDTFTINDEQVRIFAVQARLDIPERVFYVGPREFNSREIDMKKLK